MNGTTLFAGVLFGSIGLGAFIYGKKQSSPRPLVIGILLMAFPYFIGNPFVLYGVGALLVAALFFFR